MNALTQISGPTVLVGAYGRHYDSKKSALRDWTEGKDFKIKSGPYCSVRDIDYLLETSSTVLIETKQGCVEVS